MKLFTVYILSAFFFLQNYFLNAQNISDNPYRVIISSSMFQNARPEDIEASTKILANEMNKESKIKAKFEISVCKNEQELIEKMKSPFDLLYISPIEFLQLKKKFDIEPSLISEINSNYGDIYYLVTNKNENQKSIKDLMSGSINILSNANDQVPSLWLDKILRDNKLPSKNKFFSKLTLDYKTNNILLPVFFKKATAAVIPKTAYELMCELNPKIKQDIEIISESKVLVRAFFCYDARNKDTERKEFLFEYLKNLHLSNYGKQVLSLYTVSKLLPFKKEYLDNISDLYK